jgi:ribose 5-phosphate isomerase A
LSDHEELKAQAAARALDLVKPGMVLGLGTGSTARYFVEGVSRMVAQGLDVKAIATSQETASLAASLGMVLEDDVTGAIDLAVDGADEIDPDLRLVKGRGGALVREKLVAASARKVVIIADESKLVPRLGVGPLPVEVLPFLWRQTRDRLAALGPRCTVRGGEEAPFITDNGNMIVDLSFPEPLADATAVAVQLKRTLGVVDHGIFVGLTHACIVASKSGIKTLGSLSPG